MIHFFHIRYLFSKPTRPEHTISNLGGETVAYTFEPDDPNKPNGTGTIRYASAKCHPTQNFVKREGRNRAGGRLLSDRFADYYYGTIVGFFDWYWGKDGDYEDEADEDTIIDNGPFEIECLPPMNTEALNLGVWKKDDA